MSGQFEGMLEQFEIMPFGPGGGAYEAQMEEERGGRRGGGGRAGGKRPPPGKGVRPVRKHPVRARYPGPAAWPIFPAIPWPPAAGDEPRYGRDAGEPYPAPEEEPFDDGTEGEVSKQERDVLKLLPQELGDYIASLPDSLRPRYQLLGNLSDADKYKSASKAGLYLIVFGYGRSKLAYNGQSQANVRQRLMRHKWCANALGFNVSRHKVFFAPAPGNANPRTIERMINTRLIKRDGKPAERVLTNLQPELEAEMLGEAWP